MNIQKLILTGPSRAFAPALMADLKKMEQTMAGLCPDAGQLNKGLERIICAGGKRLRPLLAWTSWHMAGGKGRIVPLMTMLELMHTTSLIHDDFVDGARFRRGVATINAEDGGIAALRSGDYLLARAMEYLEIYRGTGINEALSQVSQEMCLGELDQHAGLFVTEGMNREIYSRRIRRKTAILMAECCHSGVLAGGGDKALADALWEYGLHLGLAFQLRDDLIDWDPEANSGKPLLQDLHSGVITLPLVYALESGDENLKAAVEKRQKSPADIELILSFVRKTGAMQKTCALLERECGMAAEVLSGLPSCPERDSLILLAKSISEVTYSG